MLIWVPFIVRYCKGKVMATGVNIIYFYRDIELAEAAANLFGLRMAVHSGLIPLFIKSDAKKIYILDLVNRKTD